MQILVSGSLAYDRIMNFPGRFAEHILPDKIHVLNVCFTVDGLEEKFGGTAGNIANNLALLAERPLILAAVGRDFDAYEARLRERGLPLQGIRRVTEELTAAAYITTDQADNQITGFNPGAMKCASLFRFDGIDSKNALAIVAPGNLEDMLSYTIMCRERRIACIFDPGQSIPSFSGDQLVEMLKGSKLLISNDYELEMIMRATGKRKDQLLRYTGGIITTLGQDGSVVCNQSGEVKIPAAKASQVVDPTGAGDAYRAGLIKGLVMAKELPEAARMGAVCASYAVECYGTQEHQFSQDAFWDRFHMNFPRNGTTEASRLHKS